MKYIKYCFLILLWLLTKPLSLLISILITEWWLYLLEMHTYWGYLLSFSPTIIIYGLLIRDWIIKSNDTCFSGYSWIENLENTFLIFFALIPSALISIIVIIYSIVGVRFPNKYNLEELRTQSVFSSFISLFFLKH